MKSKLKFFGILLLVLCLSVFAACGKPTPGDKPGEGGGDIPGGDEEPSVEPLKYADGTELKLGVAHNNTKTTITFADSSIVGEGLTLADGVTYQLNDLKPVWKQLQTELKVTFNNVYTGADSAQNEYLAWREKDFKGVDAVVGNASDIVEDGSKGKMVDLSKYLKQMPNFKAFLEENPIVYLSVLSDTETGSIYYAPYFDGYNDIEKYFLFRVDWIEKLLDGEGKFTAETSDKFGDICKTAVYTPYMPTTGTVAVDSLNAEGTQVITITKDYTKTYGNIVAYMNAHVTENTTGVELVNMLRDYIDTCYNGFYGNKRSQLFSGNNACWDADELVALLRCVVTNTFALTGQNTNKVTGLFPREKELNRTTDLLSLTSMFGARGYESRNDYLYFNKDGQLIDARADESFVAAVGKLNQLYKEGLILNDFDTYSEGKIAEKVMYAKNLGFGLYDYSQTQTLNNEKYKDTFEGFNLTSVINPVANYNDGTGSKYMRFTESWRSVKTNGWCIPATCTGDALNAALTMFDYMYSKDGAILMSYGPSAWRSGNTIEYKGEQIPELSEAALKELWDKAGGNYTNYARMYLGSTLPVGFVKDQGMEYQCTAENGRIGASIVSNAISKGVIKHVTPFIGENLFYTMVPTVLPLTTQDYATLKDYGALQSSTGVYSKTKAKYNVYVDLIKFGFGYSEKLTNTYMPNMPASAAEFVTKHLEADFGGTTYITLQRDAWTELKLYYDTKIKK